MREWGGVCGVQARAPGRMVGAVGPGGAEVGPGWGLSGGSETSLRDVLGFACGELSRGVSEEC